MASYACKHKPPGPIKDTATWEAFSHMTSSFGNLCLSIFEASSGVSFLFEALPTSNNSLKTFFA